MGLLVFCLHVRFCSLSFKYSDSITRTVFPSRVCVVLVLAQSSFPVTTLAGFAPAEHALIEGCSENIDDIFLDEDRDRGKRDPSGLMR